MSRTKESPVITRVNRKHLELEVRIMEYMSALREGRTPKKSKVSKKEV